MPGCIVILMSPARKLYKVDVAAHLGYKEPKSQHVNRLNLPKPDGVDLDRGHVRPWWWESTIRKWQATRPSTTWQRKAPAS